MATVIHPTIGTGLLYVLYTSPNRGAIIMKERRSFPVTLNPTHSSWTSFQSCITWPSGLYVHSQLNLGFKRMHLLICRDLSALGPTNISDLLILETCSKSIWSKTNITGLCIFYLGPRAMEQCPPGNLVSKLLNLEDSDYCELSFQVVQLWHYCDFFKLIKSSIFVCQSHRSLCVLFLCILVCRWESLSGCYGLRGVESLQQSSVYHLPLGDFTLGSLYRECVHWSQCNQPLGRDLHLSCGGSDPQSQMHEVELRTCHKQKVCKVGQLVILPQCPSYSTDMSRNYGDIRAVLRRGLCWEHAGEFSQTYFSLH